LFECRQIPHDGFDTFAKEQGLKTTLFGPDPILLFNILKMLLLLQIDMAIGWSGSCSEIGYKESALAGKELLYHFAAPKWVVVAVIS
jgi:hypothetical protein